MIVQQVKKGEVIGEAQPLLSVFLNIDQEDTAPPSNPSRPVTIG